MFFFAICLITLFILSELLAQFIVSNLRVMKQRFYDDSYDSTALPCQFIREVEQ